MGDFGESGDFDGGFDFISANAVEATAPVGFDTFNEQPPAQDMEEEPTPFVPPVLSMDAPSAMSSGGVSDGYCPPAPLPTKFEPALQNSGSVDSFASASKTPDAFASIPHQERSNTDNSSVASVSRPAHVVDTTKLREWEAKHEEELESKRQAEEAAKKAKRESAAVALKQWHEDRKQTIAKRKSANRSEEGAKEASSNKANSSTEMSWERVCGLIDFNSPPGTSAAPQRDTSRMKSILIRKKGSVAAA